MSYNEPPPPPAPGGPTTGTSAGTPRPAELLNRFLARLIDHVLLGVVQAVIWVVLAAAILTGIDPGLGTQLLFSVVVTALSVAINLGYFAYLESSRGQTVGKMALKLRTVGPDGVSNPTIEQAVKRNGYVALSLIGVIPVIGALIGGVAALAAVIYIAITLNNDVPDHQGFHDHFAGGTRVLQVG